MPTIILKKAKTLIGAFILIKLFIILLFIFTIFSVESKNSADDSIVVNNYQNIQMSNINYIQVEEDLKNIDNKKITNKQKIEVLKKIVEIYLNNSNIEKSKEAIEKGLKISDTEIDIQNFNLYKAYILNRSDDKNDIQESIKIIDQIVKKLENNNSKESKKIKFESYLLKGDTYLYLNYASSAIKAYSESENYKYSELNIFDVKASKLFLYQSLELYDLAISELHETEKLLNIIDLEKEDKNYYEEIIYKLGVYLYEEKKDFIKSRDYALDYLKLSKEMSLATQANTYYMLSATYSNLKDFKNAEKYMILAGDILRNNTIDFDKKEKLYAQYAYYKNKEDYETSLLILNEYEQIVGVEKISKSKYEIYKLKNDYENAHKYLDIHINYISSKIGEEELERYIKFNEKRHFENLNKEKERLLKESKEKDIELKEIERKNKMLTINNYLIHFLLFLIFTCFLVIIYFYNKYYQISITDSLTKVYNKRYMNKKINKYNNILMLDIDYFKKINDTYGHIAGDFLLKEVAKIIKNTVGNDGCTIRYGGEEFVVLLKNEINGYELGEKIRKIIAAQDFKYADKNIKITISLGLSDTLSKADVLLYKAKNSGRNKILKEVESFYV